MSMTSGMTKLILTSEIDSLARRIIWFEEPAEAIADPNRFLAYAFTYATHEDMSVLRATFSDDDLRTALELAPPGIIDPRSWWYWHLILDRYPPPPLPTRTGLQ